MNFIVTSFKLVNVVELLCASEILDEGIFRIEIFENKDKKNFFRARVWSSTRYNLYPSSLNNVEKEKINFSVHSEDIIDKDITLLVAENDSIIKGSFYENQHEFVEYVVKLLNIFLNR